MMLGPCSGGAVRQGAYQRSDGWRRHRDLPIAMQATGDPAWAALRLPD